MNKRLKLDDLSKISCDQQNKKALVSTADIEDANESKFFKEQKLSIQDICKNYAFKKSVKKIKTALSEIRKQQVPKIKDETNCDQVLQNSLEEVNDNRNNKNNKNNVKLSIWQPSSWEQQLKNIRNMRKNRTAPVDDICCHKCANDEASGPVFRFQVLISLILSSQTKDQVTRAAMHRLREQKCTPSNILSLTDEELEKLIYPVSFYKRKVQYIKNTSRILVENYNSDIPNNIKELYNLSGVGPKIAHICMQAAWDEITGIGVDTHVHRISNRLQWVRKPTKTPEDTRVALESWLPKNLWKEINHLLVGFGQEICQPTRPKCSECSNKTICPFTEGKYQF